MKVLRAPVPAFVATAFLVLASGRTFASNCSGTSTGYTPLNDLGAGMYLGQFQGGLYSGGSNILPASHSAAGMAQRAMITPRDGAGNPSAAGKVVFLSIGLSNTTQEFCGGAFPNCQSFSFIGQASSSPAVNHTDLVIVDGAIGGQTPPTWDSPTDANYDAVRDQRLAAAGVTEAQVQAIWIKLADSNPHVSLPDAGADAYVLEQGLGDVVRACKARYPNLRLIYLTSRIYAGYASSALNPEPYAYESGFSVKWLIDAQIRQQAGEGVDPVAGDLGVGSIAPWLVWGADPWADGTTPRSDGLTWICSDFNTSDGTHPATGARTKVGTMLLNAFLASPQAQGWFTACPADADHNGTLAVADIFAYLNAWFAGEAAADFDGMNGPQVADIFAFLNAWFAGC
jgi:hypothetical protein